jgi:phenylacetate-CoA ligase
MSKIYAKTLKTVVLPLLDKVMKTRMSYMYNQIRSLEQLDREEILVWQNDRLQQLVEHAYNNTVFYNRMFKSVGILPRDIRNKEDLGKLPVLTKAIIKENYDELIPQNINLIPHKKSATGGSTGDPLKFLLDNNSWSFSTANKIFNWERLGYNYGDKYIALGSTSLFVNKKKSIKHELYYRLNGKIGLNGIDMSDEICSYYVNIIKRKNIEFVYGYASSIYLLAKYVISNQVMLSISACFPTSEVLTSTYRKTIYEAFNCQIMDCYGASDGGITAFSIEQGYYEVGHNCIVRLDDVCKDDSGSALLTDLYNHALPLINYQIGDELKIRERNAQEYSYNGELLNEVKGRSSDILYFENGKTITGPGFTILFKDIPVDYYCVEKISDQSLICWIIKLPDYSGYHQKILLQTMEKHLGENMAIDIRYIDKPFLSASGKIQYFIDTKSVK